MTAKAQAKRWGQDWKILRRPDLQLLCLCFLVVLDFVAVPKGVTPNCRWPEEERAIACAGWSAGTSGFCELQDSFELLFRELHNRQSGIPQ